MLSKVLIILAAILGGLVAGVGLCYLCLRIMIGFIKAGVQFLMELFCNR